MNKKLLLVILGLVVAVVGWAAFRPERLWINQTVNESLEASPVAMTPTVTGPVTLASGEFHDAAHETRGTATIHRYADGRRVLRLTGFHTSNGPDVQVYLVAANDAKDNETVTKAGFVNVGALKGNVGDQNYELPAEVDLATHGAVTIWCRRFGVNFGTAPLRTLASETMAMEGTQALAGGTFRTGAHETAGMATVYRLADGRRVLRLTDFHTSNGPDVQVYMVAAADVMDDATVTKAGFVNVGALKGNVGDQNYELPADLDLSRYQAVTIWCRRFSVNFGTAPLAPRS